GHPHQRGADHLAPPHRAGQLLGLEVAQPGPQPDVRRERCLCLHPGQPRDRPGGTDVLPLEQHLPGERGPVQGGRGEDLRRHAGNATHGHPQRTAGDTRHAVPVSEAGVVRTPPQLPARGVLIFEVVVVFALSLGQSGVYAVVNFLAALTAPKSLAHQQAVLNGSAAPGRPWLDLTYQLLGTGFGLMPVVLVAYLLLRSGEGLGVLGFDLRRPRFDLGWGAAIAACVGGIGLAFYLLTHALGSDLTVVPEALPDVWWRIPVLVLSALQNALVEEVVVLGFLIHRLGQLGWGPNR